MQVKRKKIGLTEATLDQATANAIGADDETTVDAEEYEEEGADAISQALDAALETADEQKAAETGHYTNVLLQGLAGTAKTSIVRAWAKRNNINLFIVNTSTLDETDLTGVVATNADKTATVKLKTKMFDALQRPNSVLFLDEFNRGRSSVRGTLLTLINDHLIDTGTETDTSAEGEAGKIELENFLFTIAAINPARSGSQYQTDELDPAEVNRFKRVNVVASKRTTLSYLVREFGAMAEKGLSKRDNAKTPREKKACENLVTKSVGRIELAKALLSDPNFQFDNEQDEINGYDKYGVDYSGLSPRSLTNALAACDGTKESFLKELPAFTSAAAERKVKKILAKYKDSNKKANDVFKKRDKGLMGNINDFLANA